MINLIKQWTYDKPTQDGIYLCCYGDVETPANVFTLELKYDIHAGTLIDRMSGNTIDLYGDNPSYKFARLIFSPTEIKEHEND